jgi:hypothetical protein
MMHINIDPYDMLIQHNVRLNLVETTLKDTQHQLLDATRLIREQNALLKQLQQNEQVLSEAIGHLLLKVPK